MASPKKTALGRLRWLLLAPIPLAFCAAAHFGLLRFQEEKLIDWRFRVRGPLESPIKVVYVDVDSRSLNEIGGWPWSRMYFARVTKALIESGKARAVGMDFVLSENGTSESIDHKKLVDGNIEFGRYLHKAPPVVLAASYAGAEFVDVNGEHRRRFLSLVKSETRAVGKIEPPEASELQVSYDRAIAHLWQPPNLGLIDTIDGGTRLVPAFAYSSTGTFLHMSVELARLFWGVPEDGVKIEADRVRLVDANGRERASIPLINNQLIEVNWFSAWMTPQNPRISFSQVFNYSEMLSSDKEDERKTAQTFFSQGEFKDAVVLIGPVDRLLQDLATTPFDEVPVPKVGVHGNLLKTIVSGLYLKHIPPNAEWAIVFGLSGVVAGLALVGGGRAVVAKLAAGALTAGYAVLAFYVFSKHNLILPMVAPLGSVFTTTFAAVAWQVIEEQKQKGRIKGMFGAYLSPVLVERMVSSGDEPTLGGIEENITPYFSDIQSFSSFSEKLSPSSLVELMNEYLTACTDIVQEEGGTLDKYIGDAVVAIYGAPLKMPDHPLRAAMAALRVHQRVADLREKWRHEGDRWPEIVHRLQTRIGLNTGLAVVGNMGSHSRFNYTMMGDTVNIAARMESGAKSWGVYTMCTENTRAACEQLGPGQIVFRQLGRIVVKGRAQPLPIHEVTAFDAQASDTLRECIAIFEQGLAKYYARDWDGAIERFRRSEALEMHGKGRTPGSETNPSQVYIKIAAGYREEPPSADWDGVYVMKEK